MIDTFVKLVEKLTEFAKYRKEIRDKSFEVFVTQIFENIRIIHDDYLKMFESCKRELNNGAKLSVIAEILMKDRIEQEALRRSVSGFIEVYKNDERLGKYHEFFQWAFWYFNYTDFASVDFRSEEILEKLTGVQGGRESWSTEMVLELDYAIEKERVEALRVRRNQERRQVLVDTTTICLKRLRRGWTEISKAYAKLVIERVNP